MFDTIRHKTQEYLARIKLAMSSNTSGVYLLPAEETIPPIEGVISPHYIRMKVSKYTGATATLASFLCYRGALHTLEYLASIIYVGTQPINIKFYNDPKVIDLPQIAYNSWMLIAVTEDSQVRSTTFVPDQCPIKTYEDMLRVLRDKCVDDDKPITRWVVIYVNHTLNEWDMTLSCVE